MKKIKLHGIDGEGKTALVDDDLYDFLVKKKWYGNISGYAISGKVFMHRLVVNAKLGEKVDHINRNRLDNQRRNLRICKKNENAENTKRKYKGSRLPKLQDLRPFINTMS